MYGNISMLLNDRSNGSDPTKTPSKMLVQSLKTSLSTVQNDKEGVSTMIKCTAINLINPVSKDSEMQQVMKVAHTHSHRQCKPTRSRKNRSRTLRGRVPKIIPFNHDRPPIFIVEVIPTQTSILEIKFISKSTSQTDLPRRSQLTSSVNPILVFK